MKLTRHVGIEKTTNARIALIIPHLPGTENCLIAYVDNITGNLKDSFTHILGSDQGQSATNFSEVLARSLFSDTGKNVLETLHQYGLLKAVPIDNVDMLPIASTRIPLREVLVESGLMPRPANATEKFNPHAYNAQAANVGETLGTARNLLLEADMLVQSAQAKREQAYNLAPSLRPATVVTPDNVTSEAE